MAKSRKSKGSIGAILFGLPFLAVGIGVLFFLVAEPLTKGQASKSWPKVDCEVIQSELEKSSSSDGDTYRINIKTTYNFQGREYLTGRYDLNAENMYSSGSSSKRKIIKQHPLGWQGNCYVNPKEPSVAVLKPGVPGLTWIMLPFGGVFAMVGLFVMAAGFGAFTKKSPRSRHSQNQNHDVTSEVLKPSLGAKGTVAVAGFIALFWNGIVSVFVIFFFFEWKGGGDVPWFMMLFLLPFIAIGAFLMGGFFKAILASFNPEPIITLDKQSPRLGDHVRLKWGLLGKKERIQTLTMLLEGRENATYRVGTDSRTDTHVIHSQQLVSSDLMSVGELNAVDFVIPADSMHSFEANNNEIEWVIKVDGVIDQWPDIEYEYPIWVLP